LTNEAAVGAVCGIGALLVGFFIQGTSLMPWQRWLAILINIAVWVAIGKLFLTTRKLDAPAETESSENK
jgi:hypothetical protein